MIKEGVVILGAQGKVKGEVSVLVKICIKHAINCRMISFVGW